MGVPVPRSHCWGAQGTLKGRQGLGLNIVLSQHLSPGTNGPTARRDFHLVQPWTVTALPGYSGSETGGPSPLPSSTKGNLPGPSSRRCVRPHLYFTFCSYSAREAFVQPLALRGDNGPGIAWALPPPSPTSSAPSCLCAHATQPLGTSGCLTRASRPNSEATTRSRTGPLGRQEPPLSAEPLTLTQPLLGDGAPWPSMSSPNGACSLRAHRGQRRRLRSPCSCRMQAGRRDPASGGCAGVKPSCLQSPFKTQVQTSSSVHFPKQFLKKLASRIFRVCETSPRQETRSCQPGPRGQDFSGQPPIAKAERWDMCGKTALMEKAGENPFQPAEDHIF